MLNELATTRRELGQLDLAVTHHRELTGDPNGAGAHRRRAREIYQQLGLPAAVG